MYAQWENFLDHDNGRLARVANVMNVDGPDKSLGSTR
jgi:hypothetical protein